MSQVDTTLESVNEVRGRIWNNKCIRGVIGGVTLVFNIILWFAWSYLKNTQPEIRIKLCIVILVVDIIAGVINYLLVARDITYKDELFRMGAGPRMSGKAHMAAKLCAVAYYGIMFIYTIDTFKI